MKKLILITILFAQTQIFAADDSTVQIGVSNFCKQRAFHLFKIKPISGDAQPKIAHNKSICVGLYCFSKVVRGEWLTYRCEDNQPCTKQNLSGKIKVTQDAPIYVKRNAEYNEIVVSCQKSGYASEIRVTIDDYGIMFNEIAPDTRYHGRLDFKADPYAPQVPELKQKSKLGIKVGDEKDRAISFRVSQFPPQESTKRPHQQAPKSGAQSAQ